MKQITASDLDGDPVDFDIDKEPDQCPICHRAIAAIRKNEIDIRVGSIDDLYYIQSVYQCPRLKCRHLFIATYAIENSGIGVLKDTAPKTPKKETFDEEIDKISPSFVYIYNQAAAADSMDLCEVTGVALRKSLEFLIKDYCIHKNPDQKKKIEESFLGSCINNFIDDAKILACAKRASWLANDETHYVRKWENKDIDDLKILIRLSVNWITNDLLTEKYLEDMS